MQRAIRQMLGRPRKAALAIDHEVGNVLDQHWLLLWGRAAVTFMFWYAGLGFLLNFSGAVAMVRSYALEPSRLIAGLMILVLLAGSALVIQGRLVWLGAGMLSAFTLTTIPLIHHFWTMTGEAAMQARLESEEHLTVIGGLVLASILAHLENRRRRQT
jgi:transmembrane protein